MAHEISLSRQRNSTEGVLEQLSLRNRKELSTLRQSLSLALLEAAEPPDPEDLPPSHTGPGPRG